MHSDTLFLSLHALFPRQVRVRIRSVSFMFSTLFDAETVRSFFHLWFEVWFSVGPTASVPWLCVYLPLVQRWTLRM